MSHLLVLSLLGPMYQGPIPLLGVWWTISLPTPVWIIPFCLPSPVPSPHRGWGLAPKPQCIVGTQLSAPLLSGCLSAHFQEQFLIPSCSWLSLLGKLYGSACWQMCSLPLPSSLSASLDDGCLPTAFNVKLCLLNWTLRLGLPYPHPSESFKF